MAKEVIGVGKENGHRPDILEVKLAYLNGSTVIPCSQHCEKSPVTCGGGLSWQERNGLAHDPQTGGSLCIIKQEPVIILDNGLELER